MGVMLEAGADVDSDGDGVTVPSCVWISLLTLDSILGVGPGRSHHATLAGSWSAVNKLLLTHRDQVPGLLHPGSLHAPSSREGPAAPTLALVLHPGDQPAVPVVQGVGGGDVLESLQLHCGVIWGRDVAESPLRHLLLCPVRVFHQGHLVAVVTTVVSVHHLLVIQPPGIPHEVLSLRVLLPIGCFVCRPFLLWPSLR